MIGILILWSSGWEGVGEGEVTFPGLYVSQGGVYVQSSRIGRWNAMVVAVTRNRKKRYWRKRGCAEMRLECVCFEAARSDVVPFCCLPVIGEDFSIRAQVKYTSKSKRRIPKRTMEGLKRVSSMSN